MKRLFWACLLALTALMARAETYVVYVNGASAGSTSSTSQQALAFKQSMNRNGIGANVPFRHFPIVQSTSESAFAIQCQKILSQQAFPVRGVGPSTSQYTAYLQALGKLYESPTASAVANCTWGPGVGKMGVATTALADTLKGYLQGGHKAVVAGYSQGNYYVEAAIGLMLSRGDINDLSRLQVVNIASLAATALSGRYINGTLDQVVYVGPGSWPHSLPGNQELCVGACTVKASLSDLVAVGANASAHYVIETYLNESIKVFASQQTLPKIIANQVSFALAELGAGPVGVEPSITQIDFVDGNPARLVVSFDTNMKPNYWTTGNYVPKPGNPGSWPDLRKLVIEFESYTPGGSITLVASGFQSEAGVPMAADRVFTFPGGAPNPPPPTPTGPAVNITAMTYFPGTLPRLEVDFDTDMQPWYFTTGDYVPLQGKEGYWPTPRKFVIEFQSVTPGGKITLNASGFRSLRGGALLEDKVFTFPNS